MKRVTILLCGLCLHATALRAQATHEKEVASSIQKVTVYLKGAQITRTARATLPAGLSILRFTGLSAQLNAESVQVSATSNFTLLSVSTQTNYLKENELSEEAKRLQNEKSVLQAKLDRESVALQVLEEEERLILSNKTLGGQQGWSATDLSAVAELYRNRLTELKLKKLEVNQTIKKLQEDLQKIQQQIQEAGAKRRPTATSEIVVHVSAPAAGPTEFRLTYLVDNANWQPSYDIRVQDISRPIAITYKANIVQNTGEDWPNVSLTLSTGDPGKPNTRPELLPWWLRFQDLIAHQAGRMYDLYTADDAKVQKLATNTSLSEQAVIASGPSVQQIARTTTVEFQIAQPYSISSGTKPLTVAMADLEIPAYYEYYCAPKLDKTAYLTASITGWENYNLLSGEAMLFFEGTYVGKTILNTTATNDTLLISLGRDEGIVVERTREKEFSSKSFLGNKTTQTNAWGIEVRNKKKQPISIVVEDQYPLSTHEEIEVSLDTAPGANNDPLTGKLAWRRQIPAGKAERFAFRYTVKYPKRRSLTLE